MEKNCAFQYYLTDGTCLCDEISLTLDEAKALFNKHYSDMVKKARRSEEFEAGIWINGTEKSAYGETLVHLFNPEVEEGYHGASLFETTKNYFNPFTI